MRQNLLRHTRAGLHPPPHILAFATLRNQPATPHIKLPVEPVIYHILVSNSDINHNCASMLISFIKISVMLLLHALLLFLVLSIFAMAISRLGRRSTFERLPDQQMFNLYSQSQQEKFRDCGLWKTVDMLLKYRLEQALGWGLGLTDS